MIWALAVLVAGLLALVLAWPLLRSRHEGPVGPAEHDLAVYRDQLAELERDRERGLIGASEAAGAHAEIARRMIAAGRTRDRETAAQRPARAGVSGISCKGHTDGNRGGIVWHTQETTGYCRSVAGPVAGWSGCEEGV